MTWASDMAVDAAQLVVQFGRAVSYRAATHSTFDTATGARGIATADTSMTMIRSAVTTEIEFGQRSNRRVEMARFSGTAAAFSAASITPDVNDRLVDTTDSNAQWNIQRIEKKMDGAMLELICTRTA